MREADSEGREEVAAGKGAASPVRWPVDITTESTESTESRLGGLGRAKRKEVVSVESVARSSRSEGRGRGRLPRKAAGRAVGACPPVGPGISLTARRK